MKMFKKNWYRFLTGLFFIAVFVFYMIVGENSYIAVHDNMDLFIPQFQMMKTTGTFFARNAAVPFLDGISRNALPSEFSLYTVLYMLFPCFTAYVLGYLLKIAVAMISCSLLSHDILSHEGLEVNGRKGKSVSAVSVDVIIWLCGFAYGILNLFPTFGIPFASIPLIIYILRNVYRKPAWKWYLAVFCYPFVSYFSYFGLFILAYMVVAIIWLWIRDRHLSKPLVLSTILLGLGCMVFEYRLFAMMLFDHTVSIRTTMVESDLHAGEILHEIFDVWKSGMMHADDAHMYLILPVCVIYFLFLNIRYLLQRNGKGIFHDYYNLCALILIFNSVVYGLYDSSVIRNIFNTLLPPLKGFQFNRTVFFSPFLWYASLFIICYRGYVYAEGKFTARNESRKKRSAYMCRSGAVLLVLAAIAVILLQPSRYNDLYHTAYGVVYRSAHDGKGTDTMNWKEFYSSELFTQIKQDLHYTPDEWSVAYGMYPAVLEYNGIATLDGYLGFYSQEYKEAFRRVIAPALTRVPASEAYYDNWGARCYLYSGTDPAIQLYTKSLAGLTDPAIYIDAKALSDLGCRYVFSRIECSNAAEAGLTLVKAYGTDSDPYKVYVYTVGNQ